MNQLTSNFYVESAMSLIGANVFYGNGYMPMRYHKNGIHDRPSKVVRQKRKAQRIARKIERRNRK